MEFSEFSSKFTPANRRYFFAGDIHSNKLRPIPIVRGEKSMTTSRSLRAALFLLPAFLSGCVAPFSMGFLTPIPMQAWVGDYITERLTSRNDHRTPVMPPIPPGFRPYCEDPPDPREILRAMTRPTRGVPYIYEEFRDDIDFTVEKLVDKVDPPRFYPLIGPAQLHHCHWRCIVYFTETVESSYPFPFQWKHRTTQVIYIDKDHLHMCVNGQDSQQEVYRQLTSVKP
jgi:hypothetical protein